MALWNIYSPLICLCFSFLSLDINSHAIELRRLTSPFTKYDKEVMKINFNAQHWITRVLFLKFHDIFFSHPQQFYEISYWLTWLLSWQRAKNFNCYRVNDGILFSHLSSNFCAQLCMWCVYILCDWCDSHLQFYIPICNNNKCL